MPIYGAVSATHADVVEQSATLDQVRNGTRCWARGGKNARRVAVLCSDESRVLKSPRIAGHGAPGGRECTW